MSNIKENTFKYHLYLLFNILSEIKCVNSGFTVVVLFLEFLQMSYFSFQKQFENLWESNLQPIIKIFKYSYYGFAYEDFILTFYFKLVLLLSFLLLYLYVFYLVAHNRTFILISKILSFYIHIFNFILITPFLSSFVQGIDCSNRNFINDNIECWTNIYYVYFIVSIVLIIYMVFSGIIISYLSSSFIPGSKGKICYSNYETYFFIKKVILIIIFSVEIPFGKYTVWILTIIKTCLFGAEYTYLVRFQPFFDDFYYKLSKIFRSLELYYSVIVFVSLVINGDFKGGLYLVLVGSFTIIIYQIYIERNELNQYLINSAKTTPNTEIKRLLFLIRLFEGNCPENYTLGRAIILLQNNSDEVFNDSSKTLLKEISQLIEESHSIVEYSYSITKKSQQIKKSLMFQEAQLITKLISDRFNYLIKIFPKSNTIKLYYIYFHIRYTKNFNSCYMIIEQLHNEKLTINEDYFLFKLKISMKNLIDIQNQVIVGGILSKNTGDSFGFKSQFEIYINEIEGICYKLLNIWDCLSLGSLNYIEYKNLIFKVQTIINEVRNKIFNELTTEESSALTNKMFVILQKYSSMIVYDINLYSFLIEKSKLLKIFQNDRSYIRNNILNYILEGNAYIIINGEEYFDLFSNEKDHNSDNINEIDKKSFGNILSINASCCSLFGYDKTDIIKKVNVNSLIPSFIHKAHEKHIKKLINFDSKNMSKTREFKRIYSLGVHKNGYILPINMTLSLLNGIYSKISVLGLIRCPNSVQQKLNKCFCLVDTNLVIHYISSKVTNLIGLKIKDLERDYNYFMGAALSNSQISKKKNYISPTKNYRNTNENISKSSLLDENSDLNEKDKSIKANNHVLKNKETVGIENNYNLNKYNNDINTINNHLNKSVKFQNNDNISFNEKNILNIYTPNHSNNNVNNFTSMNITENNKLSIFKSNSDEVKDSGIENHSISNTISSKKKFRLETLIPELSKAKDNLSYLDQYMTETKVKLKKVVEVSLFKKKEKINTLESNYFYDNNSEINNKKSKKDFVRQAAKFNKFNGEYIYLDSDKSLSNYNERKISNKMPFFLTISKMKINFRVFGYILELEPQFSKEIQNECDRIVLYKHNILSYSIKQNNFFDNLLYLNKDANNNGNNSNNLMMNKQQRSSLRKNTTRNNGNNHNNNNNSNNNSNDNFKRLSTVSDNLNDINKINGLNKNSHNTSDDIIKSNSNITHHNYLPKYDDYKCNSRNNSNNNTPIRKNKKNRSKSPSIITDNTNNYLLDSDIEQFNPDDKEEIECRKKVEIFLAENNMQDYSNKVLTRIYNPKTKSFRSTNNNHMNMVLQQNNSNTEVFKKIFKMSNFLRTHTNEFLEENNSSSSSNEYVLFDTFYAKWKYIKKEKRDIISKKASVLIRSVNSILIFSLLLKLLVILFNFIYNNNYFNNIRGVWNFSMNYSKSLEYILKLDTLIDISSQTYFLNYAYNLSLASNEDTKNSKDDANRILSNQESNNFDYLQINIKNNDYRSLQSKEATTSSASNSTSSEVTSKSTTSSSFTSLRDYITDDFLNLQNEIYKLLESNLDILKVQIEKTRNMKHYKELNFTDILFKLEDGEASYIYSNIIGIFDNLFIKASYLVKYGYNFLLPENHNKLIIILNNNVRNSLNIAYSTIITRIISQFDAFKSDITNIRNILLYISIILLVSWILYVYTIIEIEKMNLNTINLLHNVPNKVILKYRAKINKFIKICQQARDNLNKSDENENPFIKNKNLDVDDSMGSMSGYSNDSKDYSKSINKLNPDNFDDELLNFYQNESKGNVISEISDNKIEIKERDVISIPNSIYPKIIIVAFFFLVFESIYILISKFYFNSIESEIEILKDNVSSFTNLFFSLSYYIMAHESFLFNDNSTLAYKEITLETINELYNNITLFENEIYLNILSHEGIENEGFDNILSIMNNGYCTVEYEASNDYCSQLTKNLSLSRRIYDITESINRIINDNSNSTVSYAIDTDGSILEILDDYLSRVPLYKSIIYYDIDYVEDITTSFSEIILPTIDNMIISKLDYCNTINLSLFISFMIVLSITTFISLFYYERKIIDEIIKIRSFIFYLKYEDLVEIPIVFDYLNNELNVDEINFN